MIKPFVIDYFDVIPFHDPTTKIFLKQASFFIKYIVKIPPATQGYLDFQVKAGDPESLEICRLKIISWGDNLPCIDDIATTVPDEHYTTRLVDSPSGDAKTLELIVRL